MGDGFEVRYEQKQSRISRKRKVESKPCELFRISIASSFHTEEEQNSDLDESYILPYTLRTNRVGISGTSLGNKVLGLAETILNPGAIEKDDKVSRRRQAINLP